MKLEIIKKIALFLIKFISFIPFIKSFLRLFYLYGIARLKHHTQNRDEIIDVIITSNTKSRDFNYGQSDYNLLIIIKENARPKQILKELRRFLKNHLITNLVFHLQYIPIVTTNEFKSEALKSFLMRRDDFGHSHFKSIFGNETYTTNLEAQNNYSNLHSAFQNLDYSLFRDLDSKTTRSKIKNIYRALWTLGNNFPQNFFLKPNFIKRALLLLNYPILSNVMLSSFLKLSWQALKFESKLEKLQNQSPIPLPKKIKNFLHHSLNLPQINDITITPSIIQNSKESLRGKIFIELHVNELVTKRKNLKIVRELEEEILNMQTSKLKIRVKPITQACYKVQLENAFFTFPLESHYRNLETYSLKQLSYLSSVDHNCLVRSSTHFLISQFLRFRSLEQKTSLIGSKFVKSLNLMFRYYQLEHYLEHGEFLNFRTETEIREVLTPQFSNIELNDKVTEEQWPLIRSQLLYLLKQIRKHLIFHDPGLKELNF